MPALSSVPRIYLASRSPRRRELLKQVGIHFELLLLREHPAERADVDETPLPGETPADYVRRIALTKAEVAAWRMSERRLPPLAVLAADTTVVLEGGIVGKPADAAQAAATLRRLAGRTHEVVSAVAVSSPHRLESALSVTRVQFRALQDEEIVRYVASGEPLDKAGSYAIQGKAAAFIERIEGSYSGVMGLPLFETVSLLRGAGLAVV